MLLAFERLKFDNMPFEWASVEAKVPVRRKKVRIHVAFDEDIASSSGRWGTATRRG